MRTVIFTKVIFKMINTMEMEHTSMPTSPNTKDNGKKMSQMELVNKHGLMVVNTKVNMLMDG